MGRTVLPIAQVIQQEREEWLKFRRVLRKEDQALFDEMFDSAKYYSAACAYASRPVPMEAIFMSILLEHQKTIEALQKRIEKLETFTTGNTGSTGERKGVNHGAHGEHGDGNR
ncbi:MAG: hypothetical protein HY801_15395 [Candidatus Lindowbacteria bacterium]|nr:hypothetical protein [Candidatus Lindowbacteria bacterium]